MFTLLLGYTIQAQMSSVFIKKKSFLNTYLYDIKKEYKKRTTIKTYLTKYLQKKSKYY